MKKLRLFNFNLFIAIIALSTFSALAQIDNPPPQGAQFVENRRPNLLQALNLTKEQMQQLRQLNANLQKDRQQAQRRFNQANKALDEAVYADELDENLVKERMNEVQQAHTELIRTRTMMDTSVRKILTKEQLVKFKRLRKQFMQNQRNPEGPPPNNQEQRRLMRQGNRPPL